MNQEPWNELFLTKWKQFAPLCFDLHPEIDVAQTKRRVDFEVVSILGPYRLLLAVELDSWEYHYKDRRIVTEHLKRDRELVAQGWRVLHYFGPEAASTKATATIKEIVDIARTFWRDSISTELFGGLDYFWVGNIAALSQFDRDSNGELMQNEGLRLLRELAADDLLYARLIYMANGKYGSELADDIEKFGIENVIEKLAFNEETYKSKAYPDRMKVLKRDLHVTSARRYQKNQLARTTQESKQRIFDRANVLPIKPFVRPIQR